MEPELVQVTENDTTTLTPQAGAEEFDPERAKALIAKLRPYEKQAKKLEAELASLRQADEERKRAEMTEFERLRADLAKEAEARRRLEAEYAKQVRVSTVIAAASKAGMYDPGDAVALLSDVETDGLDDALDKLRKTKPYLFKTSGPATFNPTNPAGGAGKPSDREILDEIYGARKSSIFGGGGVFRAGELQE